MSASLVCLSQCVRPSAAPPCRVFVARDDLPGELLSLLDRPGILECAVLSTCIRYEIYALVKGGGDPLSPIADHLREAHGVRSVAPGGPFALLEGPAAARHFFSVVCGLDSNILGEKQIVAQVRDAYRAALELGCTGPVLNRLFQKGLALSKRVRTKTGIDRGVCSAVSLAVRLLLQRYGDLGAKRVLVLGAGQMGKLAGLRLAAKGCRHICFASRSIEGARAVAGQCAADAVPFDSFFETLRGCDILVTATGAPHEVVHLGDVERAQGERGGRELCIVDLADPPDVDPRVSSLPNVVLFTIRCIDALASQARVNRLAAAREARAMIEQSVRDWELVGKGGARRARASRSGGREP